VTHQPVTLPGQGGSFGPDPQRPSADVATVPAPSIRELFETFGRIGLINFGGPAGQIALMHRVLVEEKAWIEEDSYLRALNFCTLLPGPEAQQLAIYVGWRLRGLAGGLIAGLLFILPGAAVVLALSILYAYAADLQPVNAAFLGVKAAVLAIVAEALLRVSRRALKGWFKPLIAACAFALLFVFSAPFPAVVLGAGVLGFGAAAWRPDLLRLNPPIGGPPPLISAGAMIFRTIRTALAWAALWATPMVLIFLLLGRHHVLFEIGAFFAKLATVTFGGAYAVLSYMAQEAVNTHGWLKPGEMVDGLGLAETTPGPLILVTEFVGFLAAFRAPAPFYPLAAGIIGALLTLWMTFTPCFLWIFVGAPYMERLEHAQRLQGALAAITAAVVGVIANLTIWFALHVLFHRFAPFSAGTVHIRLPDLASVDWPAAALTAVAAFLLFRLRLGVMKTLGVCIGLGLGLFLVDLR
jgi:chromate transporter